jgi:thiazole synthase ThiGH ThiG subunit
VWQDTLHLTTRQLRIPPEHLSVSASSVVPDEGFHSIPQFAPEGHLPQRLIEAGCATLHVFLDHAATTAQRDCF